MKLRAFTAAVVFLGVLLAGCGAPPPQPAASTSSSDPTAEPKSVPDVAGKTFQEARDLVAAAGITYDVVGIDGARFTDKPAAATMVLSSEPAAGEKVQAGTPVILKVKGTQSEIDAKAAAAEAARIRATRYEFRCSPTGDAIAAEDNQIFNSPKEIWVSKTFSTFKSCDLYIGGTWHLDNYTLEPDEAVVVKQVGADGGDISAPYMTYGAVLLLCAISPSDGWDQKYGEDPAGPKVRSEAKAAVKMCPTAPFAAELKRVANGIPAAPKTTMEDGTFTVGKDIAEGTYQVKVPAGANGVHDCYWERTGPQGGTIANDFITFAPQGPVVTTYPGEGFVSKSCGNWTKIG